MQMLAALALPECGGRAPYADGVYHGADAVYLPPLYVDAQTGETVKGATYPEAVARCDYAGAPHGNDGYGGIGPRAACMRYYRATGELPPAA